MKLISATVRNYRLHHELSIEFDEKRTVIGGPNETGKSTLVEAIHHALFLKAKGTSAYHRGMGSRIHAGKPEVELKFSIGDQSYHLAKKYAGQSGTATLTVVGGETLSGEAAESKLAELLGVDPDTSNRVSAEQWSHLWIQQGTSGEDPSALATDQSASLIQRLGTESGAAALMQSATDQRIMDSIAEAVEQQFTNADKPRANSELDNCLKELARVRAQESETIEKRDGLHRAMTSFAQAKTELVALESEVKQLEEERRNFAIRKTKLQELQISERERGAALKTAGRELEAHIGIENRITQLQEQFAAAQKETAPLRQQVKDLEAERSLKQENSRNTSRDYDAAVDQSRTAREQLEFIKMHIQILEAQAKSEGLNKKLKQVRLIEERIGKMRTDRGALPEIDEKDIEELDALNANLQRSRIELESLAAGIELVKGTLPVRLNDRDIEAGKSVTVTEPATLSIGEDTVIRITPGGGTSLAKAEQDHKQADRDFQDLLKKLGVGSRKEAAKLERERRDLSTKISNEESRLDDLDSKSLLGALNETQESLNSLQAQLLRRRSTISDEADRMCALDLKQANKESDKLQSRVAKSEEAENAARIRRDAAITAAEESQKSLTSQQQELGELSRKQGDLEAQIAMLTKEHGDSETRKIGREKLESDRKLKSENLESLQREIAELQPDQIEADEDRIQRVGDGISEQRSDAQSRQAVSESQLQSDGMRDPEAEVKFAQANTRRAEDRLANVQRQADALRLLHSLFQTEQQAVASRFTEPLLDKVSAYLRILFGPGAGASVTYQDRTFSQFAINRPGHMHGAAIPFSDLSGGTKEQVAMAMRMAMAQVLAADFDGSLPLVLDDAFVNSDPDRVQRLQSMLDHAAVQGLQVVVLTCTPADYSGLGAKSVTLQPPSPTSTTVLNSGNESGLAEIGNSGQSTVPDGVAPQGDTADLEQAFLTALEGQGGRSGNTRLRSTLGWDEESYTRIKDALVNSGRIQPGKGRGGSVSIP